MRRSTDLWFRVRALVARRSLERQVDEEFAFHVRMEADHLMETGWQESDAIAEARRRFGSETRERERTRDAWGVRIGYDLVSDVRHALRQMRRRPGFTAIAVMTLGLGIGATSVLFAVVYGLLLRPLPFGNADRLVDFWFPYSWRGVEYDHVREASLAFEEIAAYTNFGEPFQTTDDAAAQVLDFVPATANLFHALGAVPILGRGFLPGEDRPGAEPVMVISHGLWQQEFGGAPDVIGRRVQLGGTLRTIVGVMPRGFFFPSPEFRAWLPLVLDPADPNYQNNGYLGLIASTKPGVGSVVIEQELGRITRLLGERFTYTTTWDKTRDASVTPVRESLTGSVREPLLLLLGAVSLLLLIACANAASLLLARTTDRSGEMAVRVALGAGRGRLARQIATESVTLALVAAVTGALVAAGGFRTLVGSLPLQTAIGDTLTLGWQGFSVAFALALIVGLGVSIMPVRRVLRGRLDHRERGEDGLRRGTQRAHAWLISGQVTLAVTLVTGAMLLIRSVERIRQIDTGFDTHGVAVMDLVGGPDSAFRAAQDQFHRAVLELVQAIPGVVSAGLTNRLPVRDGGWQGSITVEGRDDLSGTSRPNSLFRTASPDYLRTIGIDIRIGRGIEETDRQGGALVVVVSETFARRIWPDESPLGKRIAIGSGDWRTVVGVAEEARMTSMLGEVPMTLWIPRDQFSPATAFGQVLVVKATSDLDPVLAASRRVVADLDHRVAVNRMGTMEDVVNRALAEPLRLRFFLGLFATLALLLGTVGVYGIVSYAVAQRRAEFGIRMALGAAPARVLGEVIRFGLTPVTVGVVAGLGASILLARAVRGMLFEVSSTDPASLSAAAGILLFAGAAAVAVPGWRARGVSPVEALKSD